MFTASRAIVFTASVTDETANVSGAIVSTASGAIVFTASGARVFTASGAMVFTASGAIALYCQCH